MKKPMVCGLLCLAALSGVSSAGINDEKPWDWDGLSQSTLRNSQGNGICDAVADFIKAPNLQCAFDKKAWDDHLKKEIKVERIRDRNHQDPANCSGGAFMAFRSQSENGSFPTGDNAEPAKDEFRKQVALIVCTFDDTDAEPSVTYDAAKRALVLHITRKDLWNAGWVQPEMRKGDLKKRFPLYDKYFRKYE
jgi:hypothetical protein